MQKQSIPNEVSKALDDFYCRYPLTRIFKADDFITYKVGASDSAKAFALDEANRIIREHNLPLKAELSNLLNNHTLKISAKCPKEKI